MIGSVMMPFSLRLTLSTSRVWSAMDRFLWMMPMPPSWARAMARSLSVTVSIGDERMGRLRRMLRGQLRADVHVARQHVAVAGFEQDVVEGDALVSDPVLHGEAPWLSPFLAIIGGLREVKRQ